MITHSKFTVVLDGFLIIFLNIIREIVYRNVIMFNIFHDLAFIASAPQY